METNTVLDISPPIPYLVKFWFSSNGPKCCQPIKLQDSLKCNILRKKWMMKFIFHMQINIEVFCKLILSLWVRVIGHTQSARNICNISMKAWRMKLIFCLQINTNVFLQDDSLTLVLLIQSCPKCQKQQVYNIVAIPQEKLEGWILLFVCW